MTLSATKASVFLRVRHLHPSLTFVYCTDGDPSGALVFPIGWAPFRTKITQALKYLLESNTLAYYAKS
jgi:hypothetical protein